jgi:hypothetical protein
MCQKWPYLLELKVKNPQILLFNIIWKARLVGFSRQEGNKTGAENSKVVHRVLCFNPLILKEVQSNNVILKYS